MASHSTYKSFTDAKNALICKISSTKGGSCGWDKLQQLVGDGVLEEYTDPLTGRLGYMFEGYLFFYDDLFVE